MANFTSIPTADIQVDEPLRQEVMQYIKDNFDILYNSINGVTLEVQNGSFEFDGDGDGVPEGWTFTPYPGGSGMISTTDSAHGANCFKMVHPGGSGNGGGYLESGYYPISEIEFKLVEVALKTSAAGIKVIVQIRYFSSTKTDLSSDQDLYTSTANPTSWSDISRLLIVPSTARFFKMRLIGGYTDTNVAGSVSFDNIRLSRGAWIYHNEVLFNSSLSGGWNELTLPLVATSASLMLLINCAADIQFRPVGAATIVATYHSSLNPDTICVPVSNIGRLEMNAAVGTAATITLVGLVK